MVNHFRFTFIITCLASVSFILLINQQVLAYDYIAYNDEQRWVIVEADKADIYAEPNTSSQIISQATKLTPLAFIEQANQEWYKVYLDKSKNKLGYIQQQDLIYRPIKVGDTIVVIKSGNRHLKVDDESDETYPNIEFDIYQKGQLVAHKVTDIPYYKVDAITSLNNIKLTNIEFLYKLYIGIPACAEPFSYYYFAWNGKTFNLLTTDCSLCINQPYDIKETNFPITEKVRDKVNVIYQKGTPNEYDGLDINKTWKKYYQWNGQQLVLKTK